MVSSFKEAKILFNLARRTSSVMTYSPLDNAHNAIMLVHMTGIKATCLIEHSPGSRYVGFTYRPDGDDPLRFLMSVQSVRKELQHLREFYTVQQADPITRISSEKELRAIRESDLLCGLNKIAFEASAPPGR
jgi:hypothetical protein